MSYTVTNKAKRPIVCPLDSNNTLRLPINGHKVIKDYQVTSHIKNLCEKGLLVLSKVEDKPVTKRNTTTKKSSEEKEEK